MRLLQRIPNGIDLPATVLKDIWIEVVVADFEGAIVDKLDYLEYFSPMNILNLKEDLFLGSYLQKHIRDRKKDLLFENEARDMQRRFNVWDI